jgi:predicted nucleic acid-binding protein
MIRYLLDTNAMGDFIDHRNGVEAGVRDARMPGAVIGTCLPVAAELFFGAEFSASRDINRPRVVRALSRIKCWPFDRIAVEEYGRLAAEFGASAAPCSRSTS